MLLLTLVAVESGGKASAAPDTGQAVQKPEGDDVGTGIDGPGRTVPVLDERGGGLILPTGGVGGPGSPAVRCVDTGDRVDDIGRRRWVEARCDGPGRTVPVLGQGGGGIAARHPWSTPSAQQFEVSVQVTELRYCPKGAGAAVVGTTDQSVPSQCSNNAAAPTTDRRHPGDEIELDLIGSRIAHGPAIRAVGAGHRVQLVERLTGGSATTPATTATRPSG